MDKCSKEDIDKERKCLIKVIKAYKAYQQKEKTHLNRKHSEFSWISKENQSLCSKYHSKLQLMHKGIEENQKFLNNIVPNDSELPFGSSILHDLMGSSNGDVQPSNEDMDKVTSTLRQFAREWSLEGADERKNTFDRITGAVIDHFSTRELEGDRSNIRVLVPGCGLGRLVFDFVQLGVSCQGNEFSFFMLLASNFVLNRMEKKEMFEIYPFMHTFSNHLSIENQFRAVKIPDILPSDHPLHDGVDFSITAGDFLEVYSDQAGEWDAIATCFFIDTAHDIVEYIKMMWKLLKPGGIWVNLGPLLYHFEDIQRERSIELTLEEVLDIIKSVGFEINSEVEFVNSNYSSDTKSMFVYEYRCAFFKAVKPE